MYSMRSDIIQRPRKTIYINITNDMVDSFLFGLNIFACPLLMIIKQLFFGCCRYNNTVLYSGLYVWLLITIYRRHIV